MPDTPHVAPGAPASPPFTDEVRDLIIRALCGQALADHLGDVRDAERHLWEALDAADPPLSDPAWDTDSAWRMTKARLEANGLPLPEHLRGGDDE